MSENLQNLLDKARRFCDYQERCKEEVKVKLNSLDADKSDIQKIIRKLEEENLLNEERFARAFAKGKLRSNKWGKYKIKLALQIKKLKPELIQKGLNEIDDDEYVKILTQLIDYKQTKEPNEKLRKAKSAQYAIQKGFESGLVWEVLRRSD